jgi:hypothetical protein
VCDNCSEDGGGMFFRNVDNQPQYFTV